MTSFDVFCQTCGTIRTVSPATREWPRCCGDEMARKEAECKSPAMLRIIQGPVNLEVKSFHANFAFVPEYSPQDNVFGTYLLESLYREYDP